MGLMKTILKIMLDGAEGLLVLLHIFGDRSADKKEVAEALQAAIDLAKAVIDEKLTRSMVLKVQKEMNDALDVLIRLVPEK